MWPFRRKETRAPAPSPTPPEGQSRASAREPVPEAPAWSTLPVLQRTTTPLASTFKIGEDVKGDLVALRSPQFSGPMGHQVSLAAPAGIVSGLTTTVMRAHEEHGANAPIPALRVSPPRRSPASTAVEDALFPRMTSGDQSPPEPLQVVDDDPTAPARPVDAPSPAEELRPLPIVGFQREREPHTAGPPERAVTVTPAAPAVELDGVDTVGASAAEHFGEQVGLVGEDPLRPDEQTARDAKSTAGHPPAKSMPTSGAFTLHVAPPIQPLAIQRAAMRRSDSSRPASPPADVPSPVVPRTAQESGSSDDASASEPSLQLSPTGGDPVEEPTVPTVGSRPAAADADQPPAVDRGQQVALGESPLTLPATPAAPVAGPLFAAAEGPPPQAGIDEPIEASGSEPLNPLVGDGSALIDTLGTGPSGGAPVDRDPDDAPGLSLAAPPSAHTTAHGVAATGPKPATDPAALPAAQGMAATDASPGLAVATDSPVASHAAVQIPASPVGTDGPTTPLLGEQPLVDHRAADPVPGTAVQRRADDHLNLQLPPPLPTSQIHGSGTGTASSRASDSQWAPVDPSDLPVQPAGAVRNGGPETTSAPAAPFPSPEADVTVSLLVDRPLLPVMEPTPVGASEASQRALGTAYPSALGLDAAGLDVARSAMRAGTPAVTQRQRTEFLPVVPAPSTQVQRSPHPAGVVHRPRVTPAVSPPSIPAATLGWAPPSDGAPGSGRAPESLPVVARDVTGLVGGPPPALTASIPAGGTEHAERMQRMPAGPTAVAAGGWGTERATMMVDAGAVAVAAGVAQREADGSYTFTQPGGDVAAYGSGVGPGAGLPTALSLQASRAPTTTLAELGVGFPAADDPGTTVQTLATATPLAAATPSAPAPATPAGGTGDLDELAAKLYDKIRWRLRRELRHDMERAGRGAGLQR